MTTPTGVASPPSERLTQWLEGHVTITLAGVGLAYLPFVFLGYGTDVDVANVRRAASTLRAGDYEISRPPGSPVHEAATAVLDTLGSLATNLAALALALVALATIFRLLQRAGSHHAALAMLVVAANPFFVIAATSMADHVWAVAFLLLGVDAIQRDRPLAAGIWWALAIGTRLASGVVVIAAVLAEVGTARDRDRASRAVRALAIALVLGGAWFVPPWLWAGRSAHFLQNQFVFTGWLTTAGRWLVKHELFIGLPAAAVLLAGWRVVVSAAATGRRSPLVAFAVAGGVAAEAVFFRFPWKLGHLIPAFICLVLLIGASPRFTPRLAIFLVAGQLVWGCLGLRLIVPDVPNAARAGRLDPAVVAGPLLNDARCRLDDLGGPEPKAGSSEDQARTAEGWQCTNSWWSGGQRDVGDPLPGG